MTEAVLSIGSNVGDRGAYLQSALDSLRQWLRVVSPVYETPPWGPVPQEDYLNAVLLVSDPAADGRAWLARAQAAEQAAGRTRDVRWGPRTLDIDVITVGDDETSVHSDDADLLLPHPRAHERAFVLVPWLELDQAARLGADAVSDLVARLPADEVRALRRTGVELR